MNYITEENLIKLKEDGYFIIKNFYDIQDIIKNILIYIIYTYI